MCTPGAFFYNFLKNVKHKKPNPISRTMAIGVVAPVVNVGSLIQKLAAVLSCGLCLYASGLQKNSDG